MRKYTLSLLLLVTSLCSAVPSACWKIKNEYNQRACLNDRVKMQKAEMMRLVKLIATSPNISQHDKYLVHKEQEGWEHDLPGICGTDPYCTNSELQHHINDLSAYLTSFSK